MTCKIFNFEKNYQKNNTVYPTQIKEKSIIKRIPTTVLMTGLFILFIVVDTNFCSPKTEAMNI